MLKSTEKWTFGTNSWVSGVNLPETISSSAAVISNSNENLGYLVGGYTEDGRTSKVWSLRRRDMTWIEHESKRLKLPQSDHTLVNTLADRFPGC